MLEEIKLALRIKTNVFDDELNILMSAGLKDLELSCGTLDINNILVKRAVMTYTKANFGIPSNYDKLKASYDEQKAQLKSASR